MKAPRVLQFNDCAFVARSMVSAAARVGLTWNYVPPSQVRPPGVVRGSKLRRTVKYLPYWARRIQAVGQAQVVHVHYGTSVRLLRDPGVPKRPYVLTLHGTDIRRQWQDPDYHAEIQRAIDGASHVFYANIDTAENARAARSDAEFLPALVDAALLPSWSPEGQRPSILFVSRWDEDKGVERQLELARVVVRAVGTGVDVLGLNWGPGAHDARLAGVTLLDRMPQRKFHSLVASAHLAIGQATNNFATSEFEALCMGLPMAALGHRLPRPDDGTVPPLMEGGVEDVVSQIIGALEDPRAASSRLAGAAWANPRYDAASYVERLDRVYREVGSTA